MYIIRECITNTLKKESLKTMKIIRKNASMVKPMKTKANTTLWLSNLDAAMAGSYHIRTLYFYRSTGAADFFNCGVLKAALSRALVDFYPVAGRLTKGNNRTGVDCNGEGALFMEAEADGAMNELGDLTARAELGLIPVVDYSKGISTYPILMLQITRFKCGGVCLGTAIEHQIADGFSDFYFINTWADITRGSDITILPTFDRSIFAARNPPDTSIHEESNRHVQLKAPQINYDNSEKLMFSVFKLTLDQLNALKANCREEEGGIVVTYSTYEALTGHVWRCHCQARGLPEDHKSSLHIPVDGRSRLRPPPPKGYFGNVVFITNPVALCGKLKSKPLKFAVRIIHDAIARMDDQRLRSTIDFVETLPVDIGKINRGKGVNNALMVNSWAKMPIYDADFGWGKPVYMGLGEVPGPEYVFVLPSATNDGSLLCAISMPEKQMRVFEKLLYEI